MRILTSASLHLAVRLLMGALFLYAGTGKIMAPLDFAATLYNYKLMPEAMIGLAAVTLPWIEALAGTALLCGFSVKGGSLVLSGLLLMFILILVISAARGLDVDCGCFSGIERRVGFWAIFEDSAMLGGTAFLLFCDRGDISPYRAAVNYLRPTSKK